MHLTFSFPTVVTVPFWNWFSQTPELCLQAISNTKSRSWGGHLFSFEIRTDCFVILECVALQRVPCWKHINNTEGSEKNRLMFLTRFVFGRLAPWCCVGQPVWHANWLSVVTSTRLIPKNAFAAKPPTWFLKSKTEHGEDRVRMVP